MAAATCGHKLLRSSGLRFSRRMAQRQARRFAFSAGVLIKRAAIKRGIMPPLHECPPPEGHMASYVERRKFLVTLGGAAAAWPLAALAQRSSKIARIGYLSTANPRSAPNF